MGAKSGAVVFASAFASTIGLCKDGIVSEVTEAAAKMQTLSEERAARMVSLIEDLADLEARENEEDVAAAREALARIAAGEKPVPWEGLKAELDVVHGPD